MASSRLRAQVLPRALLLLTAVSGFSAVAAPAPTPQADPQMQKVLDAYQALNPKPLETLQPAEAREGPSATDAVEAVLKQEGKAAAPEKVARVEERKIPGPAGELDVRVYTPEGSGPFPGVVYFHGGGFVLADLETYDASARALANQAQAVVVSVHYRQAPENRFPAALDDAQAAFQYVQSHAKNFNIDAKRVAIAGESAGGNLATAVAMRQVKQKGAVPVFQLLIYPFVSNDLSTPSHQRNGGGEYLVSNEALGWFWRNTLGSNWRKTRNAEALPLQATPRQLKGLPPALVMVASLDPLLDEGIAYADKLKAAGVKVDVKRYDGVTHEFFGMAPVVDKAKRAQTDAGVALRKAFSAQGIGGSGEEAEEAEER
ncbi:alpha/beta hydrolase [Comamonas sp. JC664]|uniref:alpha/beta hydrolase n=1 Tax=Comamonas sp. JC664 TaxID=2801917 RepID=UPI00191D61B4|nr:alpha/beta hydrolase [Comamonas sp. JC664]MBL0693582.1 alpha/beta hydrolase fold domain-containing protein [Comamonas sp. JC664]GHG73314.1 alpha/beta hydrolase [Comamonas sp. KCTC 72670]